MIEVQDLVKKFGGNTAVDHLSFTVEKGHRRLSAKRRRKDHDDEHYNRLHRHDRGRVAVDGFDLVENTIEAKRRIGYLPETPPLYMDMTPFEYLTFAWRLKKLPEEDEARAVAEIMERTGITHVRGRLIKNLSKGYRQRVGLAQAILGYPPVIILDEPTVADPNGFLEVEPNKEPCRRPHGHFELAYSL